MKRNTIFWIIDDNETDAFIAEQLIHSLDAQSQVISFQNAQVALTQLSEADESRQALPDIILLDLFMPIMDGWQFLEKFSQLPSSIHQACQIFVISSSMVPYDKDRASNTYPVNGFFTKPISQDMLRKRVIIGT